MTRVYLSTNDDMEITSEVYHTNVECQHLTESEWLVAAEQSDIQGFEACKTCETNT